MKRTSPHLCVLDLFSGFGGFALGLQNAGMKISAFCEIDPFCRRVLASNWPGTIIYEDVQTLTKERLVKDGLRKIDVVCGGFPCTDISVAGKRLGIAGPRSGLWKEFYRCVGEIRPAYVIVENVPGRPGGNIDAWLGTVLGDLASLGYDAEWHCIPACAVGAPHRRDRVWIIAHALRIRLSNWISNGLAERDIAEGKEEQAFAGHRSTWWSTEPRVVPLVHGLPRKLAGWRKASVMGLGNSLVPQIPELIGDMIMDYQDKQ
ncbi:MAG: DNA cytosine methyltransferase [Magnetococcus sp. DMHC-1]